MNFERRPRRVNVKLVKKSMWECIDDDLRNKSLNQSGEKENNENDMETANLESFNFSDLREKLQTVLTGETRENLTPSMALVCVLYLANEKGLELEQTDGSLTNFAIKHPDLLKN
jgi:condensin complex subunit 2